MAGGKIFVFDGSPVAEGDIVEIDMTPVATGGIDDLEMCFPAFPFFDIPPGLIEAFGVFAGGGADYLSIYHQIEAGRAFVFAAADDEDDIVVRDDKVEGDHFSFGSIAVQPGVNDAVAAH